MDKVQAGIVQKRSLKKYTERDARAAIEFAPDLITLPDYTADGGKNTPAPDRTITRLPRAEAERIEAEAGRMVVIEIAPAPKIYATETERYEALLEQECRALAGGGDNPLSLDDMQFMRYFERTALYRSLRDGFDNLREYWLAGGESAAGRD